MNTRDIVLFGVGAFAGYLLVGYLNKNKVASGATDTMGLPDTSSQTVPPETIGSTDSNGGETLVDPRLTLCEENWGKFSSTQRFGSAEQAQSVHDNFITSCLAKG
jgi:hypothetical protein